MKTEAKIFAFVAIFFGVVTPIYWFSAHEPAGAVALALAFIVGAWLWANLHIQGKKTDARYEDNPDAEIIEGAGALGFFPPKSVWPFFAALTLSIVLMGPIFGWWLSLLGVGIGIWSVCGWVYEFYRGDYQH